MQIMLGTILASKTGTNLSIKYCEKQSFDGISLCFFGENNHDDYVPTLKDSLKKINECSSFLNDLLLQRCKAIFLLESPPYGFQLNNSVFYLNKNLVKSKNIAEISTLFLQLLYQCRVYEKIGIDNNRSIWNKRLRDCINARFMKHAWQKYAGMP